MKNILITGCAGFIGFHLSKKLLDEGHKIIGLDNLHRDSNIMFKMKRLKILLESGIIFHEIDLVNAKAINEIASIYNFDAVIHLAARTGVRKSIETPVPYIQANIIGFCNIFEAFKEKKAHLIYASSSSVYGKNQKLPFLESFTTDQPISIYAATKKADELLAHYYANNYGVQITGLRFFTVYGPWNRQDMAVFLFFKSISEGRPIRLFNKGKMKRDFTYVDDINESIYRLIFKEKFLKKTLPDNAVYNIGYGKPVTLNKLVKTIEKHLGKKASIEYDDLQPGDMINTWADNEALGQLIGFKPKVSIATGIRKTAEWFKGLTVDGR